MAKTKKITTTPTTTTPDATTVWDVFQQTAEAISGDLMQLLRENGEDERISRDELYDYLYIHGGRDGKDVCDYLAELPTSDEMDAFLDDCKVPRFWS